MSEAPLGGGPQQPDEISEGASDLADTIRTLDLGHSAEVEGSIDQWLRDCPVTRLVQVLPSGRARPRVRLDRHVDLAEELDAIIGELTTLRAWLGRRPRCAPQQTTPSSPSTPSSEDSSRCPHCAAGEPSVWDGELFHYAHPDGAKLKMCHAPWAPRSGEVRGA